MEAEDLNPDNNISSQKGSQSSRLIAAADFSVKLGFFAGPMDLLLHLVEQQEVAIEQVEMALVAEQYLKLVLESPYLDLEKASEFLVIAATLLSIKSQRILPNTSEEEDSADSDWSDSDFLEELRERLKAYELTKQRAKKLRAMPQLGVNTYTRQDKQALTPDPDEVGEGGDSNQLGRLFVKLLTRIGNGVGRLAVRLEPISVVRYMMQTIDTLQLPKAPKSFFSLVECFLKGEREQSENPPEVRSVVIGSFISALELVRRGVLKVRREDDNRNFSLELGILPENEEEMRDNVINMSEYREKEEQEEESGRKEVNRG